MPKPRKEFKHLPKRLKAASAESCDFALEASAEGESKLKKFSMTAYTGAAMNVGFGYPVVIDIAGVKANRSDMPILKGHDHEQIVGHTTDVTTSPQRIRASGVVSGAGASAAADEVIALAGNGFPWQASVGGNVLAQEFVDKGEKVTVNGRSFSGPMIVVREFQLNEISFVSLGADGATSANVAAGANNHKEHEMNEFDKWLAAMGFDPDHMEAKQVESLRETFDKLEAKKGGEGDAKKTATATVDIQAELAKARNEITADMKRVIAIRKLCAGKHDEIEAKAIDEGWTAEKVELEVLRAGRPTGEGFIAAGKLPESNVLEAALAQAGNLRDIENHFDAKTLEAAHKQYRGRMGLQQFLLEAAWQGGYDGRHFPTTDPGMKSLLQAAFSTLSLPGIMANTANKFLLQGFNAVEDSWRTISRIRSVSDFKTVTSYRMTGDAIYEKVGATGELKHATFSEESYTIAADTYGKMFSITRKDIINDDLGALNDVPMRIGRGGALKLNKVFWTEFLSNPTTKNGVSSDTDAFFSAAHNNYSTSDGVLDVDALTAMELLFYKQTDRDGNPLGLDAAILLVPPELAVTATLLASSLELRDNTANTKTPTENPHRGKFAVARSSYLSNTSITNYSTTGYYLLANPADLAVIEVAFLNGQQSPTVESADADFNTLGIQMRGYHDWGVSLADYRAGVFFDGTT